MLLAMARSAGQIDIVALIPGVPRAPYALEPTAFPFPAMAAYSGRASMGGPREIALACLVVGRLVLEAASGASGLSEEHRRVRAQGARSWLGSATIPGPLRASLAKLADASVAADHSALKLALDSVMTVTANHLDSGARLELARLAQIVAE